MKIKISNFEKVCTEIESDKNFRPECTDEELLYLSTYVWNTHGTAISKIENFNNEVGRLFCIRRTNYGSSLFDSNAPEINYWHIVHLYILVNPDGSTKAYKSYEGGNFGDIALGWGYKDFLGLRCLHDKIPVAPKKDFESICTQIKEDKNFHSDCSARDVLDLSIKEYDRSGFKKHATTISEVEDFNNELGRLFHVMQTDYGIPPSVDSNSEADDFLRTWYLQHTYILVKPNGRAEIYQFYKDGKLESEIFKNYYDFLGLGCLHNEVRGI
jgi:hypothetical protein